MEPYSVIVRDGAGRTVEDVDVTASDPVDAVRAALERLRGSGEPEGGTSDPVLPGEGHP